jgi:hypothetical protein
LIQVKWVLLACLMARALDAGQLAARVPSQDDVI